MQFQTCVRFLDSITDIAIVDRKSTFRAATFFDLNLCQTWPHARLQKKPNKQEQEQDDGDDDDDDDDDDGDDD